MSYRFLPHTADIRVVVESPSLEGLLQECVTVVRDLVAGKSRVEEQEAASLLLTPLDPAELVLALVRTTLDRFNIDAIIPARLEVSSLTERGFQGVLWGQPADPAQHAPQPEIKALTRHNLTVEPTAKGWRAELLFDV